MAGHDELKAMLAGQLQRSILAGPMIRDGVVERMVGSSAERDQLFDHCQVIAQTIDRLIEHRIGQAINGLQANGYIPI